MGCMGTEEQPALERAMPMHVPVQLLYPAFALLHKADIHIITRGTQALPLAHS